MTTSPNLQPADRSSHQASLLRLSGVSSPLVLAAAAPVETRAIVRGAMDAGLIAADSEPARSAEPHHSPTDWLPVALSGGSASRPTVLLLQTGVGKVNAAGAVARLLAEHPAATVINLGICGLLPSFACVDDPACECLQELRIGSSLLASASIYADEGVQTPSEFKSIGAMGFPLGPFADAGIEPSPELAAILRPFTDGCRPIATVSTCSGTDALALEIATRTGAAGEAMEGAAIGHVIARHNALRAAGFAAAGSVIAGSAAAGSGLTAPANDGSDAVHSATTAAPSLALARFAELRVISNTTGDRPRQTWDIPKAAAKLRELVAKMLRE